MDKKEARKILGVTKESSRNDIEKKYSILLKKHRQEMLEGSEPGETEHDTACDFDRITEAYNLLMGYEVKIEEEPPGKAAPILNKLGVDEKKAKNFFYYYKYHILGAIALIIAVIYTVTSCVNRVEYDFNIAFIGDIFYYSATDSLGESIKAEVPSIQEPGFDGAYLGIAGDQQYAMASKAAVLIAAADMDVFILDRDTYTMYAKQGAFLSLDEIAPRLGVDISEHQDLVLAVEEDDDMGDIDVVGEDKTEITDDADTSGDSNNPAAEKHLYGIDVSNSKALREAGVIAEDMVAAIFVNCDQQEKAEAFLEFLLK